MTVATPTTARSVPQRLFHVLALGEAGVIAALIIIALLFWMLEPAFLSDRNIRAMLNMVSFIGIIAIGQIILLINGEFDLSVGSVAGLAAVVSGKLMTTLGVPAPTALFGGLLCGCLMGALNGLSVVVLRIPAFIQTLGALFIGQGLIQVVTGGYPVYPLPESIGRVGQTSVVGGLGWSFTFFIFAAVAADILLRHSVVGRNMYAVGGNPTVAELVGIPTRTYRISAFVTTGALSAIAGMFVMADLSTATTGIGAGWELTVIAGVVVGGVSLFGGAGTIVGGLIGILLLQVVQSGLVTVGVSANWQQIAVGLIMIVAVGLDTARRRFALSGAQAQPDPAIDSIDAHPRTPSEDGKHRRLTSKRLLAASTALMIPVFGSFGIWAHLRSSPDRAAANATAAFDKRLLWVQPLRDHPVCKLMQAGFLQRCKDLGYACEVVGNASATSLDVAATIPLAEAALARKKFAAVAVFTLDTAIYPFVAKLAAEGLPVLTWHDLPPPGTIKGLRAAAGQDLTQAGNDAALALGRRLSGEGTVALTQGSFNVEENTKARAFRRTMTEHFPNIRVLETQLEGFEATAAKARAVSILQGNPYITGVLSTTGNGAQTWAGAARTTARTLIIVGMDYMRANLDLVKSGEVYALVAQPLYEEGARTAELAVSLAQGHDVPYHNPLPAKIITAQDLAPYYKLIERAEQ